MKTPALLATWFAVVSPTLAAPFEEATTEVPAGKVLYAPEVKIERLDGGGHRLTVPTGQTFSFDHDRGPLGPRVAPLAKIRHHAIRSPDRRYYAVNMMPETKACDPFLLVETEAGDYRKIDFARFLAVNQPELVARSEFSPSFVRINHLETDRVLIATVNHRRRPPEATGYGIPLPAPSQLGEPMGGDPAERVRAIREEYARLQSETHRERASSWQAKDGPHQGEATFYSRGDALRAVRVELFEGGHSSREIRYYYEGGEPFFLFEKAGYWSFDPERKGETIDTVTERRLYLSEGGTRVVRQLEKTYEGRSGEGVKRAAGEAENRDVTGTRRGRVLRLLARAHRWPAIETGDQALRLYREASAGAGGDGERDPASAEDSSPEELLRAVWQRLESGADVESFLWRPEGDDGKEHSLPRDLAKSHRLEAVKTVVASDAERRVRLELKGREDGSGKATGTLGLLRIDGAWRIVAGSWECG